jgi:hypothetical protein
MSIILVPRKLIRVTIFNLWVKTLDIDRDTDGHNTG